MKQEIHYFDCDCKGSEHTLKFIFDHAPESDNLDWPPELWTEIYLHDWRGFCKRCWVGLKYIFGYKCKYGHWDTWLLDPKDCDRLFELLEKFKEAHKNYTERMNDANQKNAAQSIF